MKNSVEDIVTEMNGFSAALEFIGNSIEIHESDGLVINACGLAYLVKVLGCRSAKVSELCWCLDSKDRTESMSEDVS